MSQIINELIRLTKLPNLARTRTIRALFKEVLDLFDGRKSYFLLHSDEFGMISILLRDLNDAKRDQD